MDRGARRATVHRVAKSQTQLKRLSMQAHGSPRSRICLSLGNVLLHSLIPTSLHLESKNQDASRGSSQKEYTQTLLGSKQ